MVTRQWAFLSGTADTATSAIYGVRGTPSSSNITLLEGVVVDAPSMIQIDDPSIYSLDIWLKTTTEFINTLELGTRVCTRYDFGLTPLFAYVRRSRVFDNHVLAFHLSSHPICEQLFMLPMHGKYADTSH